MGAWCNKGRSSGDAIQAQLSAKFLGQRRWTFPNANILVRTTRTAKGGNEMTQNQLGSTTTHLCPECKTPMTRHEAVQALQTIRGAMRDEGFVVDGDNISTVFDRIAAVLSGPIPDPITGLVPCGCGGVPVLYSWDETLFSGDTPCLDVTVACQKCGMGGNIWHESKLDAKNWWNTAMGWREKE